MKGIKKIYEIWRKNFEVKSPTIILILKETQVNGKLIIFALKYKLFSHKYI